MIDCTEDNLEVTPSFLHGFATLFTWLSKKCCEAFLQEMHRHGKNVALRLFERHLQGESGRQRSLHTCFYTSELSSSSRISMRRGRA